MSGEIPRDILRLSANASRKLLETTDLRKLRELLGADVLEGFCRCFLHCERLLSLRGFAHYSNQLATPAGKQRDFNTVVWMLIGTLRELGLAFSGLRTALVKTGRFERTSEWEEVQEIVDRADRERKSLRDQGGFHVDLAKTREGLDLLQGSGGSAVLSVHDGQNDLGFAFPVAVDALYSATRMNKEEVDSFMKNLLGDVDRVPRLVSEIFIATLRRVGLLPSNT